MNPLLIRFPHAATDFGGVDRVNHTIAEILTRRFEVTEDPQTAALQVCSLAWDVPEMPRRLFIDHGSFADAGFWTYTVPKLRVSDTILVSSTVCERVADRLLGSERPAFTRVPYFADTEIFRPAPDRAATRRTLADEGLVTGSGPLLLVVSGYSRRKNLHLAVRLLAELRGILPGAGLIVVGKPSPRQQNYARELRELAVELRVAEHVQFRTTMPHAGLRDLMVASDLLVHLTTCRLENFGLVVAEALAAGLPVLAADWGGLPDLVVAGERGLLARTWLTRHGPRVDWRGVVGDVAQLLGDEERWSRASAAAVAFAREQLAVRVFESRLCNAVEDALRHGAGKEGPVTLSAAGEELMFSTIRMHMANPGIRSTSEEYRHLLELNDGEMCRLLTGPAATTEVAPRLGPTDRPYAIVSYRVEGDRLRITDPGCPGTVPVTSRQATLVARCDARTTVAELDDGGNAERTARELQPLIDAGVLAP